MKKIPPQTQCYACSEPAVTWEHAPPKSFFPKFSDMPTRYRNEKQKDLRTDPILVPSCHAHNNKKSKSDGYTSTVVAVLAHALSGSLSDQFIRDYPFIRKKIKTVQNGRRLRRDFIDEAKPLLNVDMIAVDFEVDTIFSTIEHAARALYFHEHDWKRRWPEECLVVSPHFVHRDLRAPKYLPQIEHMLDGFASQNVQEKVGAHKKGAHPSIFSYQTIEDLRTSGNALVMKLEFYGYFQFLAMAPGQQVGSRKESPALA